MGYAVDPWDKSWLCLPPRRIEREPPFSKQAANRGFTLIELLITVAIILTICAIAVPNLLAALDQARMAKAVGDIRAIGDDIEAYELSNDQYPTTLADINRATFPDPWGNPYQYLNFADTKGKGAMRKDRFLVPINSYFDLYSMGKDGQSVAPLTAGVSQDDVVWANDGDYIGLASQY
jgi:general secretion pathway protein G